MPYNPNLVYYNEISTKRNWSYRLYFIPASSTPLPIDLVATNFETDGIVKMPDFILRDSLKIKADYDEELPLGLPLAGEMEINMRLDRLQDQSTQDWSAMREDIVQATNGTKTITDYGELTMRNVWMVKSNNGDGSTNYDTIEFMGVQLPNPERKPKITKDGKVFYSIKCLDIFRATLQDVTIDYLKEVCDLSANEDDISGVTYLRWDYTNADGTPSTATMPDVIEGGFDIKALSYTNFVTAVHTAAINLISPLTRTTWTAETVKDSMLGSLVLYKLNTSYGLKALVGTPLVSSQIRFISRILDGSKEIAGMLTATKSDNSFFAFENVWDLLTNWLPSLFSKGYLNINLTKGTSIIAEIGFKGVFEATAGNAYVITKADMVNDDVEYTEGFEIVNAGYIACADMSENQGNTYEVKNKSSRWSDNKFEYEPIVHNMIPMAIKGVHKSGTVFSPTAKHRYKPEYDLMRGLLYMPTSTSAAKTHDWLKFALGDGTFIESESITSFSDLPTTLPGRRKQLNNWIEERHTLSGFAYTLAKAGLQVFGNEFQTQIPCTLQLEKALPRHLGDIYTIDVNDLYPFDITTKIDSDPDNAVLTSVECDFYKQESEATFFIRGDR